MNTEKFRQLIESVGEELYPGVEDPEYTYEAYLKCSEVFDVAFERNPSAFDGFSYINDENGMPLWVRPGYDWAPEEYDEDDDDEEEDD